MALFTDICSRTLFVAGITRITANWLNRVDAAMVGGLGCSESKAQAQAYLEIVPRSEYQQIINNLQAQITALTVRIEVIETCLDDHCIRVVESMPAEPSDDIIYFVTG